MFFSMQAYAEKWQIAQNVNNQSLTNAILNWWLIARELLDHGANAGMERSVP